MTNPVETIAISLGNEPAKSLGFKTEKQIEQALKPLMADLLQDEGVSLQNFLKGEQTD